MAVDVHVTMHGPFLTGHAPSVVHRALHAGHGSVADEALRRVQAKLSGSLKHPTGRYQSRVVVDRSFGDRATVNDGGSVYGPWLEGVGSRNATTRFKGYHAFRSTAEEIRQSAGSIAETAMAPIIRELA